MSASICHCADHNRGHLATLAAKHGIVWRKLVAGFVAPLVRLHHWRNIRSRMLQEALSDLDHCDGRSDDA